MLLAKSGAKSLIMSKPKQGFMIERKSDRGDLAGDGSVFVVDDNVMLVEFAATVLQAAGFKVEQFSDPKAVLQAIIQADPKPAVLITDYDMAEMNGLDLIESLHKVHPALKTVLMSGTVDDSVLLNHPAKVNRFLGKPYQPSQLQDLVTELLRT
jgi:DNA-binding NtrC family response regulator